jgi:hypothetical protein
MYLGDGIVFAADKNLTAPPSGGVPRRQVPGQKILGWPNKLALVGYVGAAKVASGQRMELWLQDFIARHPTVTVPSSVAHDLKNELQVAMGPAAGASIVEFAAFANVGGVNVPEYWHIANVHGINNATGKYDPPQAYFGCSEESLGHWAAGIPPAQLRGRLQTRADNYDPQWFHNSIELVVFNWLEAGAKAAFRGLQSQGFLAKPTGLADWEKHAAFWVLQFAAYFEAFYPNGQHYVGGGADTLSIPWP